MKDNYTFIPNTNLAFNQLNRSFVVAYRDIDGTVLHGHVTQLSNEDYQVLVQEKQVIIQCKKDENGIVSCKLNRKRNVPWVDGISNAVARTLLEQ